MARPIYIIRDGRNIIEIYRDHAEIILEGLQHNEVARAIIDLDDVDRCKEHRWHLNPSDGNQYVRSSRIDNVGNLHRFVLEANDTTTKVRFMNGNTLDCRKSNLTLYTKEKSEPVAVELTADSNKTMPHPLIIYKSKGYAELVLINNKNNEEVRVKIDLDDVDRIQDIRWTYNTSAIQNNANGCICLHRYIMNASKDVYVKFRNGDKTDCRKANLYIESKYKEPVSKPVVTPKSNTKNPKGVADIGNGFFFVSVYNEKTDTLDQVGTFSNKEEACLAYEKRVREICEELAKDAYESLVTSLMEQYYE